jgi:hypothetical protein
MNRHRFYIFTKGGSRPVMSFRVLFKDFVYLFRFMRSKEFYYEN